MSFIEKPKWKNGNSCFDCKHLDRINKATRLINGNGVGITGYCSADSCCDAFPDLIPDDVFENGHDKPRPDLGQKNKVIFEKNE